MTTPSTRSKIAWASIMLLVSNMGRGFRQGGRAGMMGRENAVAPDFYLSSLSLLTIGLVSYSYF